MDSGEGDSVVFGLPFNSCNMDFVDDPSPHAPNVPTGIFNNVFEA